MGEIGWAFIGGKAPGGTRGSVQYNDGDTWEDRISAMKITATRFSGIVIGPSSLRSSLKCA
jgi:hypothetical protein